MISFCVLGSGSSGNCTLLALRGGRHVLIDAGLSPRRTARLLGPLGLGLADVSDVLLTHADQDHLHGGWGEARGAEGWTWWGDRRHVRRAWPWARGLRWRDLDDRCDLGPQTRVHTVLLPHDQLGSVGLVIEHRGARLGIATDLGRVTPGLLQRFQRLDALAIESNYDRAMQLASGRPAMLTRRIMGGLGHLSNEQALDAVLSIDRRGRLRHVALLHLSRDCNDPRIVRRLYAGRAPHLLGRLTITHQRQPTPMLHLEADRTAPPRIGRQLSFLETL